MITWDKATLVDAIQRCIAQELPGRIAARVSADTPGLLAGLSFPDPVLEIGRSDDLAADAVTPAVFVDLVDEAYPSVDASSLQNVSTGLTVQLLVSERDIGANNAHQFLIGCSIYSDALAWVLSAKLPTFDCDVSGAYECSIRRSSLSPEFQPDGQPLFLRIVVVEALISRRVDIGV